MPYQIATGKNSEANNYSHFPDDSTAFIKSNLSASVRDCGGITWKSTEQAKGKEKEKREQELAASVLNILPPSSGCARCETFFHEEKFWIFNTRRSTSRAVPRVAVRAGTVRKKRRLERQTVAGTRRNFIFPIFYRVPRFVEDGWYSLPNQRSRRQKNEEEGQRVERWCRR